MLVESVDGEHALLGRPRSLKRRGPVLTCLSGFIEQGESIEEAVCAQSYILCIEGLRLAARQYHRAEDSSQSACPLSILPLLP